MNTYHITIVWNDYDVSEETVKAKTSRKAIVKVLDSLSEAQKYAVRYVKAERLDKARQSR